MTGKSVKQCDSTMDGIRCELVANHKGKHSAPIWKNGEMQHTGIPLKGKVKGKNGKKSLYWVGVSWVEITDKCKCEKE